MNLIIEVKATRDAVCLDDSTFLGQNHSKKWKVKLTIAVLCKPDKARKDGADIFLNKKHLNLLFSLINGIDPIV